MREALAGHQDAPTLRQDTLGVAKKLSWHLSRLQYQIEGVLPPERHRSGIERQNVIDLGSSRNSNCDHVRMKQ